MTPVHEFHLGIIGGCLARQPGMPICRLYQYELGRLLQASTGVALRPWVARYADGEYEARLGELAGAAPLDGVLMFIRLLVIRKTGVIVKHRGPGVTTYALHPFLARRGTDRRWDEIEAAGFRGCVRLRRWDADAMAGPDIATAVETPEAMPVEQPAQDLPQDHFDTPVRLREVQGISFGRMNRFAGKVLGLEDWTVEDEIREVARVREACRRLGIPLLVFGPLPAPYAAWIERFNDRVRSRLRQAAGDLGVGYADISDGREASAMASIMADGVHVNPEGHRMVAAALRGPVEAWIRARG